MAMVRVKSGKHRRDHERDENGDVVVFKPGNEFEANEQELEAFGDKFILLDVKAAETQSKKARPKGGE